MKIIHRVELEQSEVDELYEIAYKAGGIVNDTTLSEAQKMERLEESEIGFTELLNNYINNSFNYGKKINGADEKDTVMYK